MPESLSSLGSKNVCTTLPERHAMTLDDKFLETVWQRKPEHVSMPYLLRSCKAECFVPATRAISQGSYGVLAARMTGIE